MYFQKVLLVLKYEDKKALLLGQEIKSFLESYGLEVEIFSNSLLGTTIQIDLPRVDLIIVIGGDGTFLSAMRKINLPAVPFLGFNLGRLGFMAELEIENWKKDLERILRGEFKLSKRLELQYKVLPEGEEGLAINDVVLHRTGLARLLEIKIKIGDEEEFVVRADGVIIFTPTGSTAYNFSAGGPILMPEIQAFGLNFICPFLYPVPSFVVPETSKLKITLASSQVETMLTIDGQRGINFDSEQELAIEASERRFLIVQKPQSGLISKFKVKGILNDRPVPFSFKSL
ncbi:MAG: NAD(+)/NADH kinase [Desulfonauticus sp.]|nr:NAD(+)/NADH kinase [Desulfonauticus sp.]